MRLFNILSLGVAAGVLGSIAGRKASRLDYAALDPQTDCDPTVKRGVAQFRAYVLERFGGRDGGVVRACNVGGRSEHKEGRAWDWMTWQSGADTQAFEDWLFTDDGKVLRDAGVMYFIYRGRKWVGCEGGWRAYGGSNPHNDHYHLSFSWSGARGVLPWYAGKPEPDMSNMIG